MDWLIETDSYILSGLLFVVGLLVVVAACLYALLWVGARIEGMNPQARRGLGCVILVAAAAAVILVVGAQCRREPPKLPTWVTCPVCMGTGESTRLEWCTECAGTGKAPDPWRPGYRGFCWGCSGSGVRSNCTPLEACSACGHVGAILGERLPEVLRLAEGHFGIPSATLSERQRYLEAQQGKTIEAKVVWCPRCKGTGIASWTCPLCKGTGFQPWATGPVACDHMGLSGPSGGDPCEWCYQQGIVTEERAADIRSQVQCE